MCLFLPRFNVFNVLFILIWTFLYTVYIADKVIPFKNSNVQSK